MYALCQNKPSAAITSVDVLLHDAQSEDELWIYDRLREDCTLNEPRVTDLLTTVKRKVDRSILEEERQDIIEDFKIGAIRSQRSELNTRRNRLATLGISSDDLASLAINNDVTNIALLAHEPPLLPPPSYSQAVHLDEIKEMPAERAVDVQAVAEAKRATEENLAMQIKRLELELKKARTQIGAMSAASSPAKKKN